MKRYQPLLSFVLLGIGIMPPALAQPKISEANATQKSIVPVQSTIPSHRAAIADIPRLQDIQIPLTSVEGLYQEALPKSAGGAAIAQGNAIVRVTGVQVNPTDNALEVILETPQADLLQPETRTEGRTLIADIPNAILALPEGIRRDNPAEGIVAVSVTQLSGNIVQIRITGQTAVPTAELLDSDTGLIFSLTPGTEAPTADAAPAPESETPNETTPDTPNETTTQQPTTAEEPIEIVVTATRTEEAITNVPRSVTVIDREEIDQQAKVTRNVQEILGNLVPGFGPPTQSVLLNNGQNLRGRFPQVLIDGVPIKSNVFTSQARDLTSIDPSAIERIEVVRGPTAVYGDGGTGGVINIITRQPTDEEFISTAEISVNAAGGGDAFLEGDSFGNYFQYGISGNEGNVDFTLSLSREDTGAFFDAEGDRIPSDSGLSDVETLGFLGKVGINFTEEQRLQLTLNHFNFNESSNFISDPSIFDIEGIQKARALRVPEREAIGAPEPGNLNTVFNISYNHDNLLGSQVQAQAYYRNNVFQGSFFDGRPFDFTDPGVVQFIFDKELFGARLQIDTPLSSALSLLWGADYSNEKVSQPINVFDPQEFDESGGRVLRKVDELTNSDYRVNNLGLFAQLNWDLSEQWILSGGLRYERFGLNVEDYSTVEFGFAPNRDIEGGNINFDDVVFNVGAVYKPTEQISLFANFAQGFSAPDYSRILAGPPEGFTSVEDNLDVTQPQQVDNYEIGIRGNWSNFQASLAGFYNESELGVRLIQRGGGRNAVVERQPQRIYGLEASLDWQPGAGWGLGSTLTLTEGEFENEEGDFLALDSTDIQPLKLTAYVQHETQAGWRNRLQALYVGDRDRAFEDGTDFVPIDSYFTVDLISSIPLFGGRLALSVENLLNEQYFPVLSQYLSGIDDTLNYAARGRTIRLGYSIDW